MARFTGKRSDLSGFQRTGVGASKTSSSSTSAKTSSKGSKTSTSSFEPTETGPKSSSTSASVNTGSDLSNQLDTANENIVETQTEALTDAAAVEAPESTESPEVSTQVSAPVQEEESMALTQEDFLSSLGEFEDSIRNQLSALETELNTTIDLSNEELQTQIQEATAAGASDEEIGNILKQSLETNVQDAADSALAARQEVVALEQEAIENVGKENVDSARDANRQGVLSDAEYKAYLEKSAPSTEEKLVESTMPDYTPPAQVTFAQELNKISELDYNSMGSFINNMLGEQDLSEVSSASINQMLLTQMNIGLTETQLANSQALYDKMAQRATEAYLSTMDAVGTATDEIDNIISGTSDVATTISSLQVKVAKQQQDAGLTSLEARETALQAEYEYTYNQMLEQNSRLEGYMKAKLNYMGAAESSSGLTLMATTIDNAQQRLLLYQTTHSAEMIELEVAKTNLMNDYYNAVSSQLIQLQGAESDALSSYNASLDEIDANRIASEAEAQTMMLTSLGDLMNNLYTLETDQRNWEYQLATDSYNKAMQEAQIARDIENQEKAVALDYLDRLIASGAGGSFSALPADMQTAIRDLTEFVGLPESYASQTLSQMQAAMFAASSGGSGGASGSEFDQQNFLYQQALAEYAKAGGFEGTGKTESEWFKSSFPSSQAQDIINMHSIVQGDEYAQYLRVSSELGQPVDRTISDVSGTTESPTALQFFIDDVGGDLKELVTPFTPEQRERMIEHSQARNQ